jgi:heat-inducible transcriptional repressor
MASANVLGSDYMKQRILTNRESAVLKALVEEYILTGKAVGSRSFVQKYSFNISPATMRNIMYDLEAEGYLKQPHISSGRVPLEKGYRYYLDTLLETYNGINSKATIKEDVLQREIQFDKMFYSISKMLATMSKYAGIVLTPKPDFMVVKNIELVSLTQKDILVVIVTRTGIVINKRVCISQSLAQEDLHKFSKFLSGEISGYSMLGLKEKHFEKMRQKLSDNVEYQLAIDIVQLALSSNEEPDIYIDGIENILHIPDMIDEKILNNFLFLIEDKKSLIELMSNTLESDGLCSLIGKEVKNRHLFGCSFVSKSYKIGNKRVGVVGIMGPIRMDYKKVLPLVDYTGKVVSDLLTKISE